LCSGDASLFEQSAESALLGLFTDRVRHLVLEIRVGVNRVPSAGHGVMSGVRRPGFIESSQELSPSRKLTPNRMIWSATRKKIEATNTITNTMIVVIVVSLRVGHV